MSPTVTQTRDIMRILPQGSPHDSQSLNRLQPSHLTPGLSVCFSGVSKEQTTKINAINELNLKTKVKTQKITD